MARRERRERVIGVFAIVGACVSIAAGNLISKGLLATIEPLPLVFAQLAAATVMVGALAAVAGRLPLGRHALRLAVPGVFQPGLAFPLSYAGLALIPLTVSAFLFAFETILVLVLAWPLIAERPTFGKLAAACAGAIGVLLISGGGSAGGAVPMAGVALVLGGVLAAALHTISTRAIAPGADPLAMAAASLLAGLAVVLVALALWPPASWAAPWAAGAWPAVVLSGVLIHGAAMLCFNVGLARVGAGVTAILLPSIAPMSAVGAYLFFGERLDPAQMLGAALVLGAAIAIGLLPDRSARGQSSS